MKRQTVGGPCACVRRCSGAWRQVSDCSRSHCAAEKLRSYFGAYGSVTDAVVMKDPISRRSRGFGFITYADPACVDRALAQPNHILDSRRVSGVEAHGRTIERTRTHCAL